MPTDAEGAQFPKDLNLFRQRNLSMSKQRLWDHGKVRAYKILKYPYATIEFANAMHPFRKRKHVKLSPSISD